MTPDDMLNKVIDPLMPRLALTADIAIPTSDNARVMLLAIAGQESDWKWRTQQGGPARSYWQFEKGGGLAGIIRLFPTKVRSVCSSFDVPYNIDIIFEAMAWHDPLACSLARILLWSDAAPLPALGNVQAGWDYYYRNWRPGMPYPDKWSSAYATALSLVKGT